MMKETRNTRGTLLKNTNLREIYRRLLITIDFFNRWRSAYSNKSGKTQSLPRPRDDFQRIYRL